MNPPRYGPADALTAPRYSGVRTFARLPLVHDLDGVDVAVVGVPFDTATSYRPGARFGPEAIRSGSTLLRPYEPGIGVDVFAGQSVVDHGDLNVIPGNAERTSEQIAIGLRPLLEAGVKPILLGGDHSVALGELRAHQEVDGPVGLVLFDAHADVWDAYYGERLFHGTVLRRAVEEGLVAPERSLLAGMRGPLYEAADLEAPRELGFEVIGGDELRGLAPADFGARARERLGTGAGVLGFDIDVIDPAFAPGTGTPEVAGLQPAEALALLRGLVGIPFSGYDLVEVAPVYDGPGEVTAMLAANIVHIFLALSAVGG